MGGFLGLLGGILGKISFQVSRLYFAIHRFPLIHVLSRGTFGSPTRTDYFFVKTKKKEKWFDPVIISIEGFASMITLAFLLATGPEFPTAIREFSPTWLPIMLATFVASPIILAFVIFPIRILDNSNLRLLLKTEKVVISVAEWFKRIAWGVFVLQSAFLAIYVSSTSYDLSVTNVLGNAMVWVDIWFPFYVAALVFKGKIESESTEKFSSILRQQGIGDYQLGLRKKRSNDSAHPK
jgi:hypothetical protein